MPSTGALLGPAAPHVMTIAPLEALHGQHPRVIVALGTFDGVHRGHQAILARTLAWARAVAGTAAVLTFDRHPLEVLRPQRAPRAITPLPIKAAILGGAGIDLLVVARFDQAMADTPAEAFIVRALVERLNVVGVCVGYNFGFGRGRTGTPELLARAGSTHGFGVAVMPPVEYAGRTVSSTAIREALERGAVAEGWDLMGRPYAMEGTVVRGAGRGSTLGIPTANLPAGPDLLLPNGVYAARACAAGQGRFALVNVGVAPTFHAAGEAGARQAEAHLLGFHGSLYGERLRLLFLDRLRSEQRFPDADALLAQIRRDRAAAGAIFARITDRSWEAWALHSGPAVLS
jgi:riboflavin kinase/FMN adenylyltransferase